MYAAIRRGKGNPGAAAEVSRIVQEEMIPRWQGMAGFVGFYVVQTDEDTLVTVSIFASQAAAEESNKVASEWARQRLAQYMTSPLEIIGVGEVRAHAGK